MNVQMKELLDESEALIHGVSHQFERYLVQDLRVGIISADKFQNSKFATGIGRLKARMPHELTKKIKI
jgi:hypothetical protein